MSRLPPSHRKDYKTEIILSTRWDDNDIYGHLNNTAHYRLFDTAVNGFLMEKTGFHPMTLQVIGLVVESGCRYQAELHFPQNISACLRVARIGRTSVRYEIGLFADDAQLPAAEGFFVHVFVERDTRQPHPIPEALRRCISPSSDDLRSVGA